MGRIPPPPPPRDVQREIARLEAEIAHLDRLIESNLRAIEEIRLRRLRFLRKRQNA